jgi:hypothetical protein
LTTTKQDWARLTEGRDRICFTGRSKVTARNGVPPCAEQVVDGIIAAALEEYGPRRFQQVSRCLPRKRRRARISAAEGGQHCLRPGVVFDGCTISLIHSLSLVSRDAKDSLIPLPCSPTRIASRWSTRSGRSSSTVAFDLSAGLFEAWQRRPFEADRGGVELHTSSRRRHSAPPQMPFG